MPVPGRRQALVRNRFLSVDAINRCWMRNEDTYLPAQRVGDVVRSVAIGNVVQSDHPDLPTGTDVMGLFGWQDYAVTDGCDDFYLPLTDRETDVPPSMQLGLLGPSGLAAYFGMKEIAQPNQGDTIVLSAAAGAVGSLAGQIGKILGCRVIGIVGSREECDWVTTELGFDVAIDGRSEPVYKRLREVCEGGVDVYFDSLGGAVLEDVLNLLKPRSRIVLCDMHSAYNDLGGSLTLPAGPNNLLNLIFKRARMEGFLFLDYWERALEAFEALVAWHRQDAIKYHAEVIKGLRQAPHALDRLFDGANKGKLVVEI